MIPSVRIVTDGSALSTGSVGGWAAILQFFDKDGACIDRKELSGKIEWATNNQAELTAVIKALLSLDRSYIVELVSDSEYVVKGTNTWLHQWRGRNWRTSQKKPVENLDLWKQILKLKELHLIEAVHVKGHNGHTDNERCDKLANQARLSAV